MLLTPPTQFQRRRGRPAKGPTVTDVQVLTVYVVNSTSSLWIFSAPVNIPEDIPCAQLRIQTPSGWQSSSTLNELSPYAIECDFASADLDCNQPWEIVEQPVGMDFGSAKLVLPQSGVTVC